MTGSQKKFYRPLHRVLDQIQANAIGRNAAWHPGRKTVVGKFPPLLAAILLLLQIFVPGFKAGAQDTSPTEYQIKAAFLYNFAKFVEWPPQAFAGDQSPIVIGVLGKNVFDDNLEKIIHGKTVNNHPFLFKEFHAVAEATNCHILFISASEEKRLPKILESLRGASVLTVSETDQFIADGGMIDFVIEDKKIHFQINDEAAKKAGLKISSKLLSLAAHNH
ncbi:MAG: YfiR family protein [Verrucomicrobiota bacterium]